MSYHSQEKLESVGVTQEAHRFFILRWDEIFDEFTFDSWQVRSSNLKTILNEILVSCDVVEKIHAHHPNIEMLIAEATRAAKNDEVICQFFPFVTLYLTDLKTIYEEKIKNREKIDTQNLKHSTKVVLGNLSNYNAKLFECLRDIIANPPEKYKLKLYSLTLSLGIELSAMGYSLSELRNSVHMLLDQGEIDFNIRFNKFLSRFSGDEKSYTCFFHISLPKGSYKFPDLSSYDIQITKARPEINDSPEEEIFYKQDKNSFVAIVKTTSIDAYTAKYLCEQKVEAYFAISKIYQVSHDLKFTRPTVLVKENGNAAQCLKVDNSRTRYIRDSARPLPNIVNFTRMMKNISSHDSSQLLASLQYHKLALSAPTDEAKFVNMWIALETLIHSSTGSIIDRLTMYIPPSNSLDYIHQMMKFLPISFKELWRSKDTTGVRKYLQYSDEYMLNPLDMLSIFLSDPKGKLVSEFLKIISENPLMIFRMERIWAQYFETPNDLSDAIELHNKNIKWQLCRIYRARNQIMHQGGYFLELRQLIQHLHTYYITLVHALIQDLKKHSSWTISDALEHRKKLYDHLLYRLKNYQDSSISAEALLRPALILEKRSSNPAWIVHH